MIESMSSSPVADFFLSSVAVAAAAGGFFFGGMLSLSSALQFDYCNINESWR